MRDGKVANASKNTSQHFTTNANKTRNLLSLLVRLLRDSLVAVPLSRDMVVDEPCLKPDLSLMNVYLLAMPCQTLQCGYAVADFCRLAPYTPT